MKNDYEAVAFARAEAKGPKDVAHYHKKLAKDIKMAKKGNKQWSIYCRRNDLDRIKLFLRLVAFSVNKSILH